MLNTILLDARILTNNLFDLLANGVGELGAFGFASQIAGQILGFFNRLETGLLNIFGVFIQSHVTQHHHTGQ